MKQFILPLFPLFFFCASCFAQVNENNWQNGDIIFITHPQMGLAAVTGDKKQYNCAGLIMHENGQTYVYYASDKLSRVPIKDFINLSTARYSVKWLVEKELMTEEVAATMKTYCTAKLGTPGELKEDLNTEELYNAEFIWKIYLSSLGVKLTEPREAGGSADVKKDPGAAGFADKIVTVRDLYRSELLE